MTGGFRGTDGGALCYLTVINRTLSYAYFCSCATVIGKVYAFEHPPHRYYRIFVHGSVVSVVILVFLFSYKDS